MGKKVSMFNNPEARKLLNLFYENNETALCREICEREFENIEDHTHYIKNGGCKELIEELAKN